ncbi:flagellar biosynthesis regulator FlaF [Leisingera sp. ANG-S5]|uniref:flagellar biosynthesis regulator FlaF n=1 Tax=Leisingera sp. ANG-S5 TaxID=1577901 RepID=UPI00057FFDCF|nr:flagellar biosynthesis regulator FlaF [Leisingera sp. ANG-S5]KIC32987.1 flagellar biosynthesis regulator FlhF [Leisingera sp. ANG-S5]
MNALLKAKSAYSAAKSPTRTAKNFEYEVIARITRRMITATQKGRGGFNELATALNDNRKLWSIFTVDIASKGNPLPDDLKQNLFELGEFTRQHTTKVLQRKADVRPLVEINTAIMRGLRSGAS